MKGKAFLNYSTSNYLQECAFSQYFLVFQGTEELGSRLSSLS